MLAKFQNNNSLPHLIVATRKDSMKELEIKINKILAWDMPHAQLEHRDEAVKHIMELPELKAIQVQAKVKPEIVDVGRITMWVDMIWNDIFDDDELPLTAAQMNIIGKYINDAKEKIRKQFSV